MKQAAWASGKRGVFLVIFKQPGVNVIETVDRIKAQLPKLRAGVPPTVQVEVLSDRTQTIRASVLMSAATRPFPIAASSRELAFDMYLT